MAERYVKEIRQIQPYGPYQIGGWSLGGVVAFEIAQQLKRQGQAVTLLALLDSSVPPSFYQEEKPSHLEQLDDASVAQLLVEESVVPIDQNIFISSSPQEQLTLIWEQAKDTGVIPHDTGFEQFRRLAYMNCRNLLAVKYYRPDVYSGKITFFRSEEGLRFLRERAEKEQKEQLPETGGWEQLSSEPIDMYIVPGKHSEMVDEPNVQILAQALKHVLEENACGLHVA
jgi:thioesterase domain-containing protein